jgi:hypothetical protein
MQTQPLFYKRVVPLNREHHRDLYIEPEPGFNFARETNSVYVAAVEFLPASREYPVVFATAEDGQLFPVVLLGVRNNQNLYIDAQGQWRTKYIPAYIRRYPFILATDEANTRFTVCIDESYPGFNTVKEGQPLLSESGEDGPLLRRSVEFLKDYQSQIVLTTEFCKTLQGLDVMEPVQANIALKSGEKFSLTGFQCVNKAKLKALSDTEIAGLVRSEYLELMYLHLQSLGNMNSLLGLLPA